MIYECFFNKRSFRSPALSSPLWGPMWRQLPQAPDVFLFSALYPHDHTSGWAPGANKRPAGSPPRLYISKNTRVWFPQQDWSVSPIKLNTHTDCFRCLWFIIPEGKYLKGSLFYHQFVTFEWQPMEKMLFAPDNVVITFTSCTSISVQSFVNY